MTREPTIVAMGGGGFSMEPENPLLDDFVLGLAGTDRPRICFVPTASGDSEGYIARFLQAFPPDRATTSVLRLFDRSIADLEEFFVGQDIFYVGGGNTANLLTVWRLHGVDRLFRTAWRRGAILCGLSAGALCWFSGGVTDSFGPELAALTDGVGLLPGTFCPHYDGEAMRRPTYHRLVACGELGDGFAADDGAALVFHGTRLVDAVSSRPEARAYTVRRDGNGVYEEPMTPRFLGSSEGRMSQPFCSGTATPRE